MTLKYFKLLDKKDERRLKIVGRNYMKNSACTCNYCNTCHFFSWKGNSYDSNKAKNHLRECNKYGLNSTSNQESEAKIKKEKAYLDLVEKLSAYSTYTGTTDLKKKIVFKE